MRENKDYFADFIRVNKFIFKILKNNKYIFTLILG